jgi:micrococcal nuclease
MRETFLRIVAGITGHHRGLLWWLLVVVVGLGPALLTGGQAGTFSIVGQDGKTRAGSIESAPNGGCTVLDVHDGDTIRADCGGVEPMKVRLHCIDTPELAQRPWGIQARDHLRKLLAGHTITITPIERDRYGRTVGVVLADGEPVNLRMVRDGQAAMYRKYCGDARYSQAEAEARAARRGIWSMSGIQQTPWEYRHANR